MTAQIYYGKLVFDDVKQSQLWERLYKFVKGKRFKTGLCKESFLAEQSQIYRDLNDGHSFFPMRDQTASFACDYAADSDRKEWMTERCDTCPLCGSHEWGCSDGWYDFLLEALDLCYNSKSLDEFTGHKNDALEAIREIRKLPVRRGVLKKSQLRAK